MKKRRALTLAVALCLLVSLLTPGVAATNAGENAYEIQDGCRIYTVDLTTGALTELCILTDMSQVRGITCTDEGTVYVYSSYDDYFSRVDDLSAGTYTKLVTSQFLGLYGNYENMHPLCYDSTTGLICWVFNSNGNFYKLLTVNTRTNAIRDLGYIGTVANYRGDSFTTLLIKN